MRFDANSRTWKWLGLLLFAGMFTAIFWEVLPWFLAPLAPDAMPFFPFGFRTVTLDYLLASGGEFTPHHLYWLIFNPLLANKLTYVVDTMMLALAGVYYLRGRGVSYPAAWVGGLALGFSGYSFTLLSAGHRGYFHMMGCAVFSFGLLLRCFQGRQWFHFVMLGACLAWGLPYQADVLVMVVALAGAYALWLTCTRADSRTPWQRVVQVYPRFLLSVVVALVIAWGGIQDVVDRQIAGRIIQITQASGASAGKANASAENTAEAKEHQWIFATNWSMPPEDVAEFIVPGIFGNDSFQPPYPYWGRLGQAYDWQPGARSMPNYRQHTLYLGALSVCFALFACLLWWRTRRRVMGQLPFVTDDPLVDVPFWLGAGIACLLLAMGRYTPCYRLFYAVPYLDLIRCPVKFHHLVEICTAMLCGLGVEMWWRGEVMAAPAKRGPAPAGLPRRTESSREKACDPAPLQDFSTRGARPQGSPPFAVPPTAVLGRRMAMLAMAMTGVLLLAAGITAASSAAIAAHITQFGLGEYAQTLAGYTVENLVRAAVVFGVAAMLFVLGRPRVGRPQPAVWLLAVLALVLAVDLVTVARRYVRPIDFEAFYQRNPVVQAVLDRGGLGAGVVNYVTPNDMNRDRFVSALSRNGMRLALPSPGETNTTLSKVAKSLSNRPEIFWRTAHARFVIAPWPALNPLVRSQSLRPVQTFALDPRSEAVHLAQPAADNFLLAETAGGLPDAYVVASWQGGLDEAGQLAALATEAWDPLTLTVSDAPVRTMGTNSASRIIGQTGVTQRRGSNFHLTTRVDVDVPQAGLLVLDEGFEDNLMACVDGQEAPVHRANALWAAVEVPAGRHAVTVRHRPHTLPVLLSVGAGLLIGLWALLRVRLQCFASAPRIQNSGVSIQPKPLLK